MRARYPLPRRWLVTDERQGSALWRALRTLPRGDGVIVRHYSLPETEREKFIRRVGKIVRQRGLVLLVAGDARRIRQWHADGTYGQDGAVRWLPRVWAAPVHDLKQIRSAEKGGADLLLLSPVFPTRSHSAAKTLGLMRFASLARASRLPVIALGGVQPRYEKQLGLIGAYGWAGIDAFISRRKNETPDQNLNAVPT